MVDWLVPGMVGWRDPSAAWGVSSQLWPGPSSKFVNRVLEGMEAIENGVEINWGGELWAKSGEPTVAMRVVEKGVEIKGMTV